jgi:tetratricopeptide (TPR) repeat protein
LAKIYNNIGHAYLALNRLDHAVDALGKSIQFWEQIEGYDLRKLNALTSLGIAYLKHEHYQTAVSILSQAQSLLPNAKREPKYQALAREIAENMLLACEGVARTQQGIE